MDFNQNSDNQNNFYNNVTPPMPRANGFAVASFVCGILAASLCCTGILGIPLGALSILFAVLSKRLGDKMPRMSTIGILLSIAGIILGILMVAYSFYVVFNDSQVYEQVNTIMEQMYGIGLDEYFGTFFLKRR